MNRQVIEDRILATFGDDPENPIAREAVREVAYGIYKAFTAIGTSLLVDVVIDQVDAKPSDLRNGSIVRSLRAVAVYADTYGPTNEQHCAWVHRPEAVAA